MSDEFRFGTFYGDETQAFNVTDDKKLIPGEVLHNVYDALREKGYNPIHQMVGYLISGDPAYITSHRDAREMIRRVSRDDLIEELVSSYLKED